MVDEKYGLREIRNRYPAAFAIGLHENWMSLVLAPPVVNRGIMFAGEIGVGGPISLILEIFSDCALKVARSQSDRRTVSPLRATSPLPFFTRISCWSLLGSLCTIAALSGPNEAVAPATMTWDFEPCA